MTPEEKQQKKARAWLLDPEQASELLGISRSSVVRLILDNALPAICLRSGKRKKVWRIRREVLEKWVIGKEREQVKRQPSSPISSAPLPSHSRPGNGKALD